MGSWECWALESYCTGNVWNWEYKNLGKLGLGKPYENTDLGKRTLSEHRTMGKHKTMTIYTCPGNRRTREHRSQVIEVIQIIEAPRNIEPWEYSTMETCSNRDKVLGR